MRTKRPYTRSHDAKIKIVHWIISSLDTNNIGHLTLSILIVLVFRCEYLNFQYRICNIEYIYIC